MILISTETNDKNLLESIVHFSFTYPFLFTELLSLYKGKTNEMNDLQKESGNKGEVSGKKHLQNIFAIQMIQNYYMYQEQIFTWIFVLRDYGRKMRSSILEIYLEVYWNKTISQKRVFGLRDEYKSNEQEFIKDFLLTENNKSHNSVRLQKAFDDLFNLVHTSSDSKRLELIYNKTKHGGFCMYSDEDHDSERPYVPSNIQEKKDSKIFVEPCYLPTKLEIFEDIHSRIPLYQYPFLEIISVHLLQEHQVESEYKKVLNPAGPTIAKNYAQMSDLLNKPLFSDY